MKELFEALLAALRRGETAALCTILGASGSAPRGAGAKMAVFADGSTIGTVGGGAVELRTIAMAKEAIASGRSLMHGFSLAKNQIEDLGMICGGNVTIYIQILSASEPEVIPFLEDVCALFERNENSWLRRVARGLRVEVAVDAVGLEIEDDQPLRLVPKAVHHALQQHLFPGCRRVIVRRVGQDREFELAPERSRG